MMKTIKSIVLCDFDGTVTNQDVTDEILNRFASKIWVKIGERYLKGTISHMEMNKQFAEIISVTPAKLRNFLKSKVTLRKGFRDFVRRLSSKNIPLVIVGSGWNFYIREILGSKNTLFLADDKKLIKIDSKHINVISNKIEFKKKDQKWESVFPWSQYSCKVSSPCKGTVADLVRFNLNVKIIGIGNSMTDFCMIGKTDELFTTGELSAICDEKRIFHHPFSSFDEVNF